MTQPYEKPGALLKLGTEGGEISKAIDQKWVKKAAERAARTDRLALQNKRIELGQRYEVLDCLIKDLLSGQIADAGQQERMMNYANLLGMQVIAGGGLLTADALTEAEKCRIVQSDGSLKKGTRRFGVAELVSDLREMIIDMSNLADLQANLLHDIAKAWQVWRDESGVSRSPYEVKAKSKHAKDDEPEEAATVGHGMGAVEDAPSPENVHLQAAQDFIRAGRTNRDIPESPIAKTDADADEGDGE